MKEVKFAKETKPAEDEISPEQAEKLYNEGGFYIVKDLPVGTEFGCDMKSYNTGIISNFISFSIFLIQDRSFLV